MLKQGVAELLLRIICHEPVGAISRAKGWLPCPGGSGALIPTVQGQNLISHGKRPSALTICAAPLKDPALTQGPGPLLMAQHRAD